MRISTSPSSIPASCWRGCAIWRAPSSRCGRSERSAQSPCGWGRAARSPWARCGWSRGRRWRTGCRSSSSRARGARLVRYCVLISAIAMFVLSAGLLHAGQRAARPPFTSWYALALLLLAVGLFGIMIQLSLWQRRELAGPHGAVARRVLSAPCRHRRAARVTSAASSAGREVASGVLPGRHGRGDGARRGCHAPGVPVGAGHARALSSSSILP